MDPKPKTPEGSLIEEARGLARREMLSAGRIEEIGKKMRSLLNELAGQLGKLPNGHSKLIAELKKLEGEMRDLLAKQEKSLGEIEKRADDTK